MAIARTPEPPYYAVIFTSIRRRPEPGDGYEQMAERMLELAKEQPGFLGVESARNEIGITVSYWKSLEDIASWKEQAEHREAQRMGYERWYSSYHTRICLVERDYTSESR